MITELDKLRKKYTAEKIVAKKRKKQLAKERAYRETPGVKLGTTDAMAEAQQLGKEINEATTTTAMDKALRKFNRSFQSHTEMKEKLADPDTPYPTPKKRGGKVSRKRGGKVSRRGGGKIMQGYKAGGKV